MAALDPRGEFRLAQGVPTAGNLNAAGGFPQLTIDGVHWLQVVSGGKLPAAGGGRFAIPWSDMWVAMLKIYSIDYAQHGTACMSRIITLNELHDAIMRCVMAGMAFTVIGSVEGALAAFVRYAREHAQSNPASWVLAAAQLQALPAVPAAAPALPAPAEWFLHLEFGMALDQSGSPLTLAALLAVLPGWCSHLGRAGMAFEDSATELNDMVELSRPNWAATAPRRRALAVAAHVCQRLQSFELVLPALPNFAFASASLYRLSRDEAYCQFFKVAWRSAYRSLALLFGPVCDGATALQLTGRLLAASPSADPTASLDASVTLLLAHLDTPVLRTASASDRATAMSALLKASARFRGCWE